MLLNAIQRAISERMPFVAIKKKETMRREERYKKVIEYFEKAMPVAESELNFENPYQLLVAVILSAQCTDKRVNLTTPALFEAYPTPFDLAKASPEEIYQYIKSISFLGILCRAMSLNRKLCLKS